MDTNSGASHGACPFCARQRTDSDVAGLGWSSEHQPDGTLTWICADCTREQLWLIETLLAPEPALTSRVGEARAA